MLSDQALYGLAKEIQWSKFNYLGEDCSLIMMGDLYIVVYLLYLGILLFMLKPSNTRLFIPLPKLLTPH